MKVASLRKTVLCSIGKAMENCTCEYLASKRERTYKNVNHKMTHVSTKLSTDIETNPGPRVFDVSKIISAPYCAGDVTVFGSNTGSRYVAMSLTVTLYNYAVLKIQASLDLVKIMEIGIELYSQESNSGFLMTSNCYNVACIFKKECKSKITDAVFGLVNANEKAILMKNFKVVQEQA